MEDKIIGLVSKHGLPLTMALICIYLFMSLNVERRELQSEAKADRVMFIDTITKDREKFLVKLNENTNVLKGLSVRIDKLETELRR